MATLFDIQRLASFTDGDPALEAELIELFVETANRYLGELAAAGDRADRWRTAAHSLKGAAGNIGAMAVAELAARAERAAPDAALLAELQATFALTRATVDRRAA